MQGAWAQAAAHGYVEENHAYPDSLNEVGLPGVLESGPVKQIQIVDGGFELTLRSNQAKLNRAFVATGAPANRLMQLMRFPASLADYRRSRERKTTYHRTSAYRVGRASP